MAPAGAAAEARRDPAGDAVAVAADPRLAELWRCGAPDCPGYTYDPLAGEPEQDIPARTAFQDLPWDFACPRCGAATEEFRLLRKRSPEETAGG